LNLIKDNLVFAVGGDDSDVLRELSDVTITSLTEILNQHHQFYEEVYFVCNAVSPKISYTVLTSVEQTLVKQ